MVHPRLRQFGGLLLPLLTGCATQHPTVASRPQTGVSYRAAEPAGQSHYQLAMGDVATQPVLEVNPPPAYPPALVARRLPLVEITAQLIVNGQGVVDEVRVPGEAEADADTRQFIQAVRQIALHWHFSPLVVTHWAADANGQSHQVDSERMPFSQFYVFRFECRDGHPLVSSDAAP